MADNRHYYYIRLKDNFFDSPELQILESQQDGYLYSNILLKLYLKSLKNEGKLRLTDAIPYNAEMIATLSHHQVGTVERALKAFLDLGLIDILSDGTIYMLNIQEMIGKSSTEADRKRSYRKAIEKDKKNLLGQMSDERSREIENRDSSTDRDRDRDREKDRHTNREISNSSSKEDSLSISCGETSEKVSPPNEKAPEQEAIFLFMPLRTVDENGNSEEVGIPVSWVESMKNLYPDLDVEGEVRKAVAWCLNNPKARKTSAGWQRYLNAWLTRAVDKKSQFPNFEEQKELKRKQEREESIRRGEELERIYGKTLRL